MVKLDGPSGPLKILNPLGLYQDSILFRIIFIFYSNLKNKINWNKFFLVRILIYSGYLVEIPVVLFSQIVLFFAFFFNKYCLILHYELYISIQPFEHARF